jgi:uncharacterized membrane protein
MPTVFGMVMLGVLLVGIVVGVVLWVRQVQRRRHPERRAIGHEAPYDENRAAAEQTRTGDRNGWF